MLKPSKVGTNPNNEEPFPDEACAERRDYATDSGCIGDSHVDIGNRNILYCKGVFSNGQMSGKLIMICSLFHSSLCSIEILIDVRTMICYIYIIL